MIQPSIILDFKFQNFKYLSQTNWIFFFINDYKSYFLFKKKNLTSLKQRKKSFFKLSQPALRIFVSLNQTDSSFLYKNLFNINFLRKEKIYTKLKYSRVPQYDIVSGGSAALLAGFLGFLICEKFGFELLDSGDFYFFFMYLVFISFFSRLFLKLFFDTPLHTSGFSFFSLKWLFLFLFSLISFIKKRYFR